MVHRATVPRRVGASCQLAFAALAIAVCALSDIDPVAIAITAVFAALWVVIVASLSRRPARTPLPPGTRLAPAGRSARTALLLHLGSLVVFVPVLLLSRGGGRIAWPREWGDTVPRRRYAAASRLTKSTRWKPAWVSRPVSV